MTEDNQQPNATGELGVVHTKREHEQGCPALSGETCRCGGNAIPNVFPDSDDSMQDRDARVALIERAKAAGEPEYCPRRAEGVHPAFQTDDPAPDRWVSLDMGIIGAIGGRHCSYCGSLHPDDFIRLLREGVELQPTDKSYKAYLGGNPEKLGRNGDKFYFQHLSDEQRHEIVDMVNARQINFGHPGFFYRLPFFMVRQEAT